MIDKEEILNLIRNEDFTTIRYKYRFKTLEEFKTQYGSNWRNYSGDFAPKMDYLLGRPLSEFEIYGSMGDSFRLSCPYDLHSRGYWIIDWRMLTCNDDIKALNKKIVEDKDTSKCMFKILID